MDEPTISTVDAEHRQRTVGTLTAAFVTDPLMRWMFPDPEQYLDAFPRLVDAFGGGAFEHGSSQATDNFSGATLWLPPGVAPDDERLMELMGEELRPEIVAEVGGVLEEMETYHPQDEPTWYLAAIGVDPFYQRRGIGAALLRAKLREIDEAGLPAYLESSNPLNMSLYERHGFRTMGKIQVGSSPVVHPMLRPAARR